MKSKLKVIIPIGIALIAIALAFVFIRFAPTKSTDIGTMISTAQQYLTEQKYEQAIAEFQKIIEIDPKNADAYIGMAKAYIGIGDTDKAIEVLEDGYEQTGDDRILEMLEELKSGEKTAETTTETTEITEETVAETENISVSQIETVTTAEQTTTTASITESTKIERRHDYSDGWYSVMTYDEDRLTKIDLYDDHNNKIETESVSEEDIKRHYDEIDEKKKRANTTGSHEYSDGDREETVYDENGDIKEQTQYFESEYSKGNWRKEIYENGQLIETQYYTNDDNPASRGIEYEYYVYFNGIKYPDKEIKDVGEDSYDRTTTYTYDLDEHGNPIKQYRDGSLWYEFENTYKNNKLVCVYRRDTPDSPCRRHFMYVYDYNGDLLVRESYHCFFEDGSDKSNDMTVYEYDPDGILIAKLFVYDGYEYDGCKYCK